MLASIGEKAAVRLHLHVRHNQLGVSGVVPTVTSETHCLEIINDWTKEWSVNAVATACSYSVVSVMTPQRWTFMSPLHYFYCPGYCSCILLVRLPSWSNTACVWWYLSIPLLISKLCFMNVKQVQWGQSKSLSVSCLFIVGWMLCCIFFNLRTSIILFWCLCQPA